MKPEADQITPNLKIVYIQGEEDNDIAKSYCQKAIDHLDNQLQSSGYPYEIYNGCYGGINNFIINNKLLDQIDEYTSVYLNAHGHINNDINSDGILTSYHRIFLSSQWNMPSWKVFSFFFNKTSHIELFSCFSGRVVKDLKDIPIGSSVVTHSSSYNVASSALNIEEFYSSVKELYPNRFINYAITILISAEQENSLSIMTLSGMKTFKVKLPAQMCSITNMALLQKFSISDLKSFYKDVIIEGVPSEAEAQIEEALEFLSDWKVIDEIQAQHIDRIQELLLIAASLKNNFDQVKCLLDEISPDVKSMFDDTPLFAASSLGSIEMAKLLVSAHADLNIAKQSDGMTPLCVATENNYVEIVKLLINTGADVDKAPYSGITPLHRSAYNGNVEIAKLLIDAHANLNTTIEGATPLYLASQNGRIKVVKLLIDAHADLNMLTQAGGTALCIAAQNGYVEIVKALTDGGADVNYKNPLYSAACIGKNLDITYWLLEHGAIKDKSSEICIDRLAGKSYFTDHHGRKSALI